MDKETAEIINQIVDVLETVKNNVGNLTKAVKLMDKKIDDLQTENLKLKEELADTKRFEGVVLHVKETEDEILRMFKAVEKIAVLS